jgi:protein required for attachment to host cells
MALTLANLQVLLDQFKGDGLMISCYADLTVATGGKTRWPGGVFKAKTVAIQKMLTDDPRGWRQVERNLQAVGRALDGPDARHARGMAVFAALQRGFLQSYALDVPVENDLVVHPAPYLVPLLQSICRQRDHLVVLTDTHRGRLYAAAPGGVRLLEELDEEVPSRQHSSGERWGKEQATIARHREDRIRHYQKELIEHLKKAWMESSFQGVVLLGEHEILEHVRKQLPPQLAAHVVHEGPSSWTDKPLAVAEAVGAVLTEVDRNRETRVMEELEDRLRQDRAIAAGPRDVVEALQAGRVGPRGHGSLILGPDPREAVARCTACRFLSTEMPRACPRCAALCVDANLWEEVLLLGLRHGITAHCVRPSESLSRCGGLAALLPREEPGERGSPEASGGQVAGR